MSDEAEITPTDTMTLTFEPPIQVEKMTLSALTLREPTLGQVRDASVKLDDALAPTPGAFREYQLTLLQLNSGKGRAFIDAMPASAVKRGVEFLEAIINAPLADLLPDVDPTQLTLTLDPPLKGNSGGEVADILLREPTGGEMRKAEDLIDKAWRPGPVRRYQARLIELVSGLPAAVVAQIPFSKAKEAIRFLEGFEFSARRTGTP